MTSKSRSKLDVIVVGAGAAGLAAARRLSEAGARVIVLEARSRIGGRVLTIHDQRSPAAIELGAEFLHGEAPEVREIARKAGLSAVDITGDRWVGVHGRFSRANDFWQRIDRILSQADPQRTPDRSLAEFLAGKPGGRRFAGDRTLAREFVEGFHAAELERISERSVAGGGNPGEDPSEQRIGRLIEGYDALIDWLAAPLRSKIRLNRVVAEIEWSRRSVRVRARTKRGRAERFEARAVLVTVPVALLHPSARGRGTIRFAPEIPSLRDAASCLEMGHVQRIVLMLDRSLVRLMNEQRQQQLAALSFLHASKAAVPVWWTSYPLESGILVGWAGGPAALEIEEGSRSFRAVAVDSLAESVGVDARTIDRHVHRAFTHDWSRDPFSRGAYSYCLVGGSDANERLARPIRGTIFIAGEAANREGRTGTVHGAIASGQEAAKGILKALGNG